MEQLSIFSSAKRETKLSTLGDSLEKLNEVINWEIFRPMLLKAVIVEEPKGPGGRRRFDVVMMFKVLVLARLFNLSDDQAEYQINDRISFMRFLDLGLNSTVPDAKTIWLFRETLKNAGIMNDLFAQFNGLLEQKGLITREGTIVDAELRDVAAIAAYALGVECPSTWTGRVPAGIFKDVTEAGPHMDPGAEYRNHQTKPTPALSELQSVLAGHNVVAYLPFDNNTSDALNAVQTVPSGDLSYTDAYFGKGVDLSDGFVTLKDVSVGTESFSVAFWLKATPLGNEKADPSLISNKDWQEGKYKGFILSYRGTRDLKFNVGDDKNRMDYERILPGNYDTGWMHVILTVDRPNKKVHIYYDFAIGGDEAKIPAILANTSFDSMPLNIGQDGTGKLEYSLPVIMDEFIMTSDVLSESDVAALKAYYEK